MGGQNSEASEAHFEFDGGTAQGLDENTSPGSWMTKEWVG